MEMLLKWLYYKNNIDIISYPELLLKISFCRAHVVWLDQLVNKGQLESLYVFPFLQLLFFFIYDITLLILLDFLPLIDISPLKC